MATSPLSSALQQGLKAAKANLLPGLLLQVLAFGIVLSYYFVPQATGVLEKLGNFSSEAGHLFGMVSTGLCGGLIPFLYLRLFGGEGGRQTAAQGLLYTLFWAYKGLEIGVIA